MPTATYAAKRTRAAERDREATQAGRDIGDIPKVLKPARKKRCAKSLLKFLREYFPERFLMPFSADHLEVIAVIERAVLRGGLFALAMPRGSGKTTIVECAALWAILYGYRQFVVLIGSDEDAAVDLLTSIKSELEHNDLLCEDFPEACFPIRALDGISHRCKGQLHHGSRTAITWKDDRLILPTIPKSKASGAIIRVAGITGKIRGMKYTRPDGRNVRPDFVIPDDPQTDESAKSHTQCVKRLSVICGAILGLAGPGQKIAGVMPCTVICKGDAVDQLLDRKAHPEWQGVRMRMVYVWPVSDAVIKLLDQYTTIRAEDLESGLDLSRATAFWKKHRKKIEAGTRVGWKERHNEDECSALQHAFNLRLERGEAAYYAEFENDPIDEHQDNELLTAEELMAKVNGYARGVIPQECTHVTGMIDVQGDLLYWVIVAWCDDFTGYVVDYGAFPDQGLKYFTLAGATHTLKRKYRGRMEARITAGLHDCVDMLFARKWVRDDGADLPLELLFVDAAWQTKVVYNFCRETPHKARVLPRHGKGVLAKQAPMDNWKKADGERVGLNWRLRRNTANHPGVRHVIFDTNWWKSFLHARFSTAKGDRGCLSFWKPKSKGEHKMPAEHCRAEKRKCIDAGDRKCDEWSEKPGKPDNHIFDCLVGAAVAAAMQGCVLPEMKSKTVKKRKRRVRYAN
jgi:hypothetical protein